MSPCVDCTPTTCLPFFSCQEQHPPRSPQTCGVQPLPSSTPHHSPATRTFSDLLESSFLPRGFSSLNLQSLLHHPAPHLPTLSTFSSTFTSQLEGPVSKGASLGLVTYTPLHISTQWHFQQFHFNNCQSSFLRLPGLPCSRTSPLPPTRCSAPSRHQ